ncbi:ice-binding family protein [Nocardia sp. NBC_01377]|uniref:ice-binding family protein n=1 Tax=Nocardia sp. NBC_01377 TaxID=2903595 RepID=UPI003243CDD5
MAPTLTSLNPAFGPPAGFNSVVITGSGFANVGPISVLFGTTATTFTIDSNTQLTAIVPPGTGTVNVTVQVLLDGTSNPLPYTYGALVPALTSLNPASGSAAGGTTVVLTGTNLTGVTSVSFGGTSATSFTVNSATQITAVTPAHVAGAVQVTVTAPGGTSNGVTFTYIAVPTLASAVPNSGPPVGGTVVVLTGTGLTGTTAVSFGATPAPLFTVNSDTQITVLTPAHTAGAVQVTATTPGGTSNGVTFTYISGLLPVNVGTASTFAVLGAATVTNGGATAITGDLGVSPGTAVTGFPPGTVTSGTIHAGDATAAQAHTDLQTAYLDAVGRIPTGFVLTDLGGQTLTSGVYKAVAGIGLTGTVTLDGQGDPSAVFIFQAGTTLITGANSAVNLVNGATAANVFWQVGSSATLGADTDLAGTVLAFTSVTVSAGTTADGRILALNGAVTLDTNTITRP